jgi:putative restriction endonuclease
VGLGESTTTKKSQIARDPMFRSLVLEAYGRQCAVCGFDVRMNEVSLAVEAAHIKWHQRGGPPLVTNGVAMCAVHHAIFDRGAISITLDHRVIVATGVSRSESAKMWLWRFDGQGLQLPPRKNMFPDVHFVTWHRKNVFLGSP